MSSPRGKLSLIFPKCPHFVEMAQFFHVISLPECPQSVSSLWPAILTSPICLDSVVNRLKCLRFTGTLSFGISPSLCYNALIMASSSSSSSPFCNVPTWLKPPHLTTMFPHFALTIPVFLQHPHLAATSLFVKPCPHRTQSGPHGGVRVSEHTNTHDHAATGKHTQNVCLFPSHAVSLSVSVCLSLTHAHTHTHTHTHTRSKSAGCLLLIQTGSSSFLSSPLPLPSQLGRARPSGQK